MKVDDGLVIYAPGPPQFVDLNESAAELWYVLKRSAWSADGASKHLAAHYELASPEACQVVEDFLVALEAHSLITRSL